jgi:hypothetical protein
MSTNIAKRVPASKERSDRGSNLAGSITPSAFVRGAVEQATDLGNGYVIVKVGGAGLRKSSREDELPAIPKGQVRRILARYTGSNTSGSPLKPKVTRTEPEDNSHLLNALDNEAMARRQALHERGELLSSAQIRARLGITRQALSKAVSERRMFWVGGNKGAQWYPSFFADDMTDRRMLEQVSVALGDLPGAVKWQFFTTPKHSLDGRTPVDAVRAGALDRVLRTAGEVMERNLGR